MKINIKIQCKKINIKIQVKSFIFSSETPSPLCAFSLARITGHYEDVSMYDSEHDNGISILMMMLKMPSAGKGLLLDQPHHDCGDKTDDKHDDHDTLCISML